MKNLTIAEQLLVACGAFQPRSSYRALPRADVVPHQGKREVERRRRQMAFGKIDESASIHCLNRISERLGP